MTQANNSLWMPSLIIVSEQEGLSTYAHLFTDLASRQVYPVFTKSKLVVELTGMMSKLFFAHPEWKPNGTAIDRKIKVDMETGYQSEDFKEY